MPFRRLVICPLLLLCLPSVAQDATPEKPSIEIAAVSIAKPKPGSEFGESLSKYKRPGMEIDLAFTAPGKAILGLDAEKSSLAILTEDGQEIPLSEGFDGQLELDLDEDAASGVIQLRTETLPPGKTTRLSIIGEVTLKSGEAPTTDVIPMTVEKDARLKIADVEVVVSEIGDAYSEEFSKTITLQTRKKLDFVKSIEFLSSSGKPVESSPAGNSYFGFGDDFTYDQSYAIASKEKQLKLRVTRFTKSAEMKIPVKIVFGLGL
ncbi:MAG: hypothetical protein KDA96_00880 [Planctomycetaceae bacterium]|nr:hypothetical protein [Planctomycetaceae bacterium]